MKTTFIYRLIDPETLQVRYIGKSDNPRERWLVHKSTCGGNLTHCQRWILLLKNKGLVPVLDVIEEISDEIWTERETFWINEYKRLGAPLTNLTHGGEGTSGRILSEEEKQNTSKRFAGIPLTEDHKKKLSEAAKRKFIETDSREKLSRRWAKLTDDQVREVRRLAIEGVLTDRQIAQQFSIHGSSVSEIRHGTRYCHALDLDSAAEIVDNRHKRSLPRMKRVIELRKSGMRFEDIAELLQLQKSTPNKIVAKAIEYGYVTADEMKIKRTVSDEGRRKLSEAHKGHKPSAETRAKMSRSQLESHAEQVYNTILKPIAITE